MTVKGTAEPRAVVTSAVFATDSSDSVIDYYEISIISPAFSTPRALAGATESSPIMPACVPVWVLDTTMQKLIDGEHQAAGVNRALRRELCNVLRHRFAIGSAPAIETVEALITDCNGMPGEMATHRKTTCLLRGIKPQVRHCPRIWGRDVPRIALDNGDIDVVQGLARFPSTSLGQTVSIKPG